MSPTNGATTSATWPELPLAAWRDTYATLHMYTQIVGKIRLALSPRTNQWWNVPLYVTSRGLTTSPMPYRERSFAIDFDFIDHNLLITDSNGAMHGLALVPRTVASFRDEVFAILRALEIDVRIAAGPSEVPDPIPFAEDTQHRSYDADYAHRFWDILRRVDAVFHVFRARFRGKCSPVHFFWGSFDLAVTRFCGRTAPMRPAADVITRYAYDEECSSVGFWPGNDASGGAAFYSYFAPEPPGFGASPVTPSAAGYNRELKEFVLAYDAVRRAASPAAEILSFAQSTYDAGAALASWDREALAFGEKGAAGYSERPSAS